MCWRLFLILQDLLSPQKHYDWGLRAIKSVLVVAGSLLRAEEGQVGSHEVYSQIYTTHLQLRCSKVRGFTSDNSAWLLQLPWLQVEAQVLFRALRDFNIPKILAQVTLRAADFRLCVLHAA